MNSRWFIPTALGAFCLLMAGLWAYLSATQEDMPAFARETRLVQPASHSALGESSTDGRGKKGDTLSNRRSASRPRGNQLGKLKTKAQAAAAAMANRLDDSSVEMRTNLKQTAIAEIAAASARMRTGDYESAVKILDDILRKVPDHAGALSARAVCCVELNRYDEAAATYATIVKLTPRDADARYNYGVLLYRLKQFRDARAQLRAAVSIRPDHASAQYNLASLAQSEGRIGEARTAWENFTRLRPDVASGWFNLGVTYMDFDMPLEAAQAFSAVVSVDPEDADAYLNLGIALATAGFEIEALDPMEKAARMQPCDETISSNLMALQEILAMGPNSDNY